MRLINDTLKILSVHLFLYLRNKIYGSEKKKKKASWLTVSVTPCELPLCPWLSLLLLGWGELTPESGLGAGESGRRRWAKRASGLLDTRYLISLLKNFSTVWWAEHTGGYYICDYRRMWINSPSGHPQCRWGNFLIRTDLEKLNNWSRVDYSYVCICYLNGHSDDTLTADYPILRMWCNAKYLQICSDEKNSPFFLEVTDC